MDPSKTFCVVVEVTHRYELYVNAEDKHDAVCKANDMSVGDVEELGFLISSGTLALTARE